MNRRIHRFILPGALLAGLLFVSGCGNADRKALREAAERNITAMNKKDVELYMQDVDGSRQKLTRALIEAVFKHYDLSSRLLALKIVSLEGDTAEIDMTVETRRVSGPRFRDNRTVTRHQMKKIGGRWKFVNSKVMQTTYLE